jgi:hypothetical protein
VRALKAAVAPRRANGVSKSSKAGKGRRKDGVSAGSEEAAGAAALAANALEDGRRQLKSWGIFEPLHKPLGPVFSLFEPFWSAKVALGIIGILLFTVLFRSLSLSPVASPGMGLTMPERVAAYEELWRREESELWSWLEERIGIEGLGFPSIERMSVPQLRHHERRRKHRARELNAALNEGRMATREIDYAIRVTRERLATLEEVMRKRGPYSAVDSRTPLANGDHSGGSAELPA